MAKRAKRELNYEVLADFRYEIRRYLNFSERAARARGVEPHQHQALLALKGLPANAKATVGVLAERLQIQHHSAVELADRLVQRGFLRRSRSQTDRREVLLHLTASGEEIVWELSLPHRAELRSAGRRLLVALEAALEEADGLTHSRTTSKQNVKQIHEIGKKTASN
jgi:DNA-binding MarR family transcriptional regulator